MVSGLAAVALLLATQMSLLTLAGASDAAFVPPSLNSSTGGYEIPKDESTANPTYYSRTDANRNSTYNNTLQGILQNTNNGFGTILYQLMNDLLQNVYDAATRGVEDLSFTPTLESILYYANQSDAAYFGPCQLMAGTNASILGPSNLPLQNNMTVPDTLFQCLLAHNSAGKSSPVPNNSQRDTATSASLHSNVSAAGSSSPAKPAPVAPAANQASVQSNLVTSAAASEPSANSVHQPSAAPAANQTSMQQSNLVTSAAVSEPSANSVQQSQGPNMAPAANQVSMQQSNLVTDAAVPGPSANSVQQPQGPPVASNVDIAQAGSSAADLSPPVANNVPAQVTLLSRKRRRIRLQRRSTVSAVERQASPNSRHLIKRQFQLLISLFVWLISAAVRALLAAAEWLFNIVRPLGTIMSGLGTRSATLMADLTNLASSVGRAMNSLFSSAYTRVAPLVTKYQADIAAEVVMNGLMSLTMIPPPQLSARAIQISALVNTILFARYNLNDFAAMGSATDQYMDPRGQVIQTTFGPPANSTAELYNGGATGDVSAIVGLRAPANTSLSLAQQQGIYVASMVTGIYMAMQQTLAAVVRAYYHVMDMAQIGRIGADYTLNASYIQLCIGWYANQTLYNQTRFAIQREMESQQLLTLTMVQLSSAFADDLTNAFALYRTVLPETTRHYPAIRDAFASALDLSRQTFYRELAAYTMSGLSAVACGKSNQRLPCSYFGQ